MDKPRIPSLAFALGLAATAAAGALASGGSLTLPENLKELHVYNQVLHPSGHAFPCENTSTVTLTQARSHHPGPSESEPRPLF